MKRSTWYIVGLVLTVGAVALCAAPRARRGGAARAPWRAGASPPAPRSGDTPRSSGNGHEPAPQPAPALH
ncbi:MAG: hypothetical protein ACLGI7_06425 [Gammaproteobacteria bacterium]